MRAAERWDRAPPCNDDERARLPNCGLHLKHDCAMMQRCLRRNTLAGVVGFGGGPIACEEFRMCHRAGLKCLYVPTKARCKQVAATPVKDAYKIDISASPESYGPIALELARDGTVSFRDVARRCVCLESSGQCPTSAANVLRYCGRARIKR